jgi:fatty-acyl-CoA synthase
MAESIAALVLARATDEHTGLVFEERTWTWADVVRESSARAQLLIEHGLAGRHLGVLLENTPEYVFLLGAAALTGSVIVGINHTRRGAALSDDIHHTDCARILTDGNLCDLLDDIDLDAPVMRTDERPWLDAVAERLDGPHPVEPPEAGCLFLLIFTSGSTGAPKAVRMTQRRAREQMAGLAAVYTDADVLYCSMPLFHANALNGCLFPGLSAGATIVLKRRFSASAFLPDVRRHGCTSFNYVGRSLSYILAQPETPHDRDNHLVFCVGAEASPHDRAAFRRRFGCFVVEGYTSSEGVVSINPFAGMPEEALGRARDDMDVVVLDPQTGVECPRARFGSDRTLLNANECVGEIVRRDADAIFEGYHANEIADAERTRDGFYWTGDLGFRDDDGTFYFAGRSSDWLRVDGENFAAGPVETILARHPAVRAAVVYGVPDPNDGDRVMAALELFDPVGFDTEVFASFLDEQRDLGTKCNPHFVRVTDALPLTGTGKIDRGRLRAERWRTTDPTWWRPGRTLRYEPFTDADADAFERTFEATGRRLLLQ